MRNKGWVLLIVLAVLLAAIIAFTQVYKPNRQPDVSGQDGQDGQDGQALLDAVFDRIGVTQWSEAIGWLEYEETGAASLEGVTDETPVWVSRHGHRYYHSVPLCGGLKSPVRKALGEAEAEAFVPCPVCWALP